MIFPIKRVKEELINEFAVSKDIETFSQMHSIQPEALRSWIHEKMNRARMENQNTMIYSRLQSL
ncbi:MAG: hypothetical protein II273_06635 [Lachnospiraceae bacterium]|nr:hypothetical protein [Lachnospiraceae bacterium]